MIINHIEKLFITGDDSWMHPVAKLLVLASKMQEADVADEAAEELLKWLNLCKYYQYKIIARL